MQNFLPKAAVLAVIAGGFAFTGDLGWVANRGLRVLDAADIATPSAIEEPPAAEQPAVVTAPTLPPAPVAAARPVPADPQPQLQPQPRAAPAVAPMKPPATGASEVAWASLRPGDRVTLWLAGAGPRCLVLDVVEPAGGEALAYEAVAVSADGRPLAAATPPFRVIVGRPNGQSQAAGIAKGGMVHVAPAGIAAAGEGGRWLGPVEAISLAQ